MSVYRIRNIKVRRAVILFGVTIGFAVLTVVFLASILWDVVTSARAWFGGFARDVRKAWCDQ